MVVDMTKRFTFGLIKRDMLKTFSTGFAFKAVWMPTAFHRRDDATADGHVASGAHHVLRQAEGGD